MGPRFQEENFRKNLELVDKVRQLAQTKECTPAQLALAWVLAKAGHIVPIPGTTKLHQLRENAAAVDVELTASEMKEIDQIATPDGVAGARYPAQAMTMVNG